MAKFFQVLYATHGRMTFERCSPTTGPMGECPCSSACGVDYGPLQDCLIRQDFQAADRQNILKLCELAGPDAVRRKWLLFYRGRAVSPKEDLQTIDFTLARLF